MWILSQLTDSDKDYDWNLVIGKYQWLINLMIAYTYEQWIAIALVSEIFHTMISIYHNETIY